MLDLDFAYFNIQNSDRKGLADRKFFLDRLAPFLYGPRIERLVDVPQLGVGCNIHLPLGAGNVHRMDRSGRQRFLEKTGQLLQELNLGALTVERSLREIWPDITAYFSPIWGDDFMKALAYTLAREFLSRQGADKIILVGEVSVYGDLLEALNEFELPLSVQSLKPGDYEVPIYRLLYERGCAVSNSFINPQGWEKSNLVLVFDQQAETMAAVSPGRCLLKLTNHSRGLAPELEDHLEQAGIGGSLGTMAPVLESCLKAKAGIFSADDEQDMSRTAPPFLVLQKAAEQMGVWDLFLDKV